jgi:hypothetical protein
MNTFTIRHPTLTAALFLLLVAAALFAPYWTQPDSLMWPRSGLGTDMLAHNWPSVTYFRQALAQDGEIPLWRPGSAGGVPMIGNPGVRVFYPPQLLIALLPVPQQLGYALLNVIHFWLAGIGAYGLARRVGGLSEPAALLAGVLVMLTPRLSSNVVGDVGYTHGMCWLPLCLLWTRLAFDRRSWRYALAAGLALCCIYVNNIQFILYAVWLVILYFAFRSVEHLRRRDGLRVWLADAGILALIGATTLGFSAYQAFPFASYLPYQARNAMTLDGSNYLALPLPLLMNSFFPMAQKFPEWETYAGLLPLLLLPLVGLHPNRRERRWWALLLIVTALFALGSTTPLYTLLFYLAPGFNLLRAPARIWTVTLIALALLTALAVDVLWRYKDRISGRTWHRLTAWGVLLGIITLAGRILTRQPDEPDWLIGFSAAGGLLLALVALWRWQQGRITPRAFSAALVLSVLLDLFPTAVAFGTPRPISDFLNLPTVAQTLPATEAIPPPRLYSLRHEITDALAVAHQMQTAEGLNSFQFADYSHFMRLASGCPLTGLAAAIPPCVSNEIDATAYQTARPNPLLLGLLNVKYILADVALPADSRLKLTDEADGLRLYTNADVLPRAFVLGAAEWVDGVETMDARLQALTVVDTALLTTGQPVDTPLPQSPGMDAVSITRYTANEIQMQTDRPDAGILVLADPVVPGWRVEVDGQARPLLRVFGTLRGVALESGAHSVRFTFRPPALIAGLIVSLLTLGLSAALLLWGRRTRTAATTPVHSDS